MAYSSDFFPSLEKTREFWSDTKSISAKKIADSYRYLNQQYKKMVDSTKKKDVSNFQIFRENVRKAEIFSLKLEKKYGQGAGFIKYIDDKGNVEFKTGQYGKYTQEERRELMAFRDYIMGNWAMSPGKFELYKQEINMSPAAHRSFILQHPDVTSEEYENFQSLWDVKNGAGTLMWQKLRQKGKYQIAIETVLTNAKKIIDNHKDGFDRVKEILAGAASVDDFNQLMEDEIKSLVI